MADDKDGRENQAQNAERRQREREVDAALERGDEQEPPMPTGATDDLDGLSYPATGDEVVAEVGDREIELADGTIPIADLIPSSDAEAFESPTPIRSRVRYPGVARAMKRIVEAAGPFQNETLRGSQRDAYEKTLRALADIDALDDDAVVDDLVDWIVDRVETKAAFPGSRVVRRQAAKIARAEGHSVGDNDWLGA